MQMRLNNRKIAMTSNDAMVMSYHEDVGVSCGEIQRSERKEN